VHADDSPEELALTGRPAAWIKELVCRYTVLSLRLEGSWRTGNPACPDRRDRLSSTGPA
jgi:hypothetical protein